jgi:CHAD domain-containing protein
MSAPDRHQLRLSVKKLRYRVDFFVSIFPNRKQAKAYVRELGRLQDGLGRYNDVATTRQLVDALASEPMPSPAQLALGAIVGWQARDLPKVERSLRNRWRAFRDVDVPWADA